MWMKSYADFAQAEKDGTYARRSLVAARTTYGLPCLVLMEVILGIRLGRTRVLMSQQNTRFTMTTRDTERSVIQ